MHCGRRTHGHSEIKQDNSRAPERRELAREAYVPHPALASDSAGIHCLLPPSSVDIVWVLCVFRKVCSGRYLRLAHTGHLTLFAWICA